MKAPSLTWPLALLLVGCWGDPPPLSRPRSDAGPDAGGPETSHIEALDSLGRAWPLDAIPRRPLLRLSTPVSISSEAVFLLEGSPDASLSNDLERPPLLVANQARRIDHESHLEGEVLEIRPREPLAPGARITLAVAAWAGLPAPLLRELRVAVSGAGAVLLATWPADGTPGVPTTIPELALRFDEAVVGLEGIALRASAGSDIPSWRATIDCQEIGWSDGFCVALYPDFPLGTGSEYRLEILPELKDGTGAEVGPAGAGFLTAPSGDPRPPELVPLDCGVDETITEEGCALADDRSWTLRLRATGPMRAILRSDGSEAFTVAPRGEIVLRLEGLEAAADLPAELELRDLDANLRRVLLRVRTTEELAPLSITEVRHDPAGPEPHQEYVEVLNSGDVPVDLEGFAIADRADREGDVIGRGHVIPAGARALIVGDGFDPLHPDDAPVPPGVPLIRVGSSIASSGLTNSGEPIFLRDPLRRRVSAAPSLPSPGPGHCLVRVSSDPREGSPESFRASAAESCTPGAPDRLPTEN